MEALTVSSAIAICFGYCGKGFKNMTTIIYIGLVTMFCFCPLWEDIKFACLAKYFRYCCVTNFEKRLLLIKIKQLLLLHHKRKLSTLRLFISTLVHYYQHETMKQVKESTESRLLLKSKEVIEEILFHPELYTGYATLIFEYCYKYTLLNGDNKHNIAFGISFSISYIEADNNEIITMLKHMSVSNDFSINMMFKAIEGLVKSKNYSGSTWSRLELFYDEIIESTISVQLTSNLIDVLILMIKNCPNSNSKELEPFLSLLIKLLRTNFEPSIRDTKECCKCIKRLVANFKGKSKPDNLLSEIKNIIEGEVKIIHNMNGNPNSCDS